MSYNNGVKIVNDGLVAYYDATGLKSYPNGGSTWYDLSGYGNNLSWTSPAPTYTTYNNVPVISTTNIASSLRAAKSTTYNGMRLLTDSYTAFAFFKPNSTTSNKILVSFGPANNNCSGESIHPIAIGSSGKFAGGACGGLGTWGGSSGVTPTTDRFWCVCSTYSSPNETIYVNGDVDKTATMTTSTPSSVNNAISLGWIRDDGASYSMDANIGMILLYNRALTSSEVTRNYNAMKSRFRL